MLRPSCRAWRNFGCWKINAVSMLYGSTPDEWHQNTDRIIHPSSPSIFSYNNIMHDLQQKLYNFYACILFLLCLPLRPTTFCTTLLSYLKCKIIGISEYDRNCCTVCTTISTICTLIVTLGWGFRALPWYAHTSKVRILLIPVQLFC